jgi:pyruvate-ferredoxin/flavodoxin oxidoreductase
VSAVASSFSAFARAEGLASERVFLSLEVADAAAKAHHEDARVFPAHNVWGDDLVVEKSADFEMLVRQAKDAAEQGFRVTLIGTAAHALASRRSLRALVVERLGVVVHVVADAGAMRGAVYGLMDTGFGLLFSAGPQDSFDLTLIARRAAEDAGIPFIIVHEQGAYAAFEAVSSSNVAELETYVGAARARLVKVSDPQHPVFVQATERQFGKRSAFALSAAMREMEAISGRRHDVVERTGGEAEMMIVGLGVVGDHALALAERTRGANEKAGAVGALKLTALRPFDGPRIVKSLARAHAVTVIEQGFDPLTETMPLARELKAAFSDAITWAPGYPGVGRVPRFASAVVGDGGLTERDLATAISNMKDGDQAVRSFVFGEEDAPSVKSSDHSPPSQAVASSPRLRVSCADEASAAMVAKCIISAVSGAVGLRSRAELRGGEGGVVCVDVSASRDVARAEAAPVAFDWVLHQKEDLAATAALAAAFIAHSHRVVVDGPSIARAIARASGAASDEAPARAAVESGRWRTRAQ